MSTIYRSIIYEEYKHRGESGERHSCIDNGIQRAKRLDGVPACRAFRFAPVHHLVLVSEKHGANHSFSGKDLRRIRADPFAVFCRRRDATCPDARAARYAGKMDAPVPRAAASAPRGDGFDARRIVFNRKEAAASRSGLFFGINMK